MLWRAISSSSGPTVRWRVTTWYAAPWTKTRPCTVSLYTAWQSPTPDLLRPDGEVEVFILDPPYLSTDCGTYTNTSYWRLSDYLDVLKCLQGTKFVYFTSSKSTIVELAEWIARNPTIGNPFEGAKVIRQHVSGIALNYDDMMLVKVT